MNNVKYIVKQDAGVVIAIIESDGVEVAKRIAKLTKGMLKDEIIYRFVHKVKFKGVAKCAPEDKFDETIGKTLAARRASIKYEKYYFDLVVKILGQLESGLYQILQKHSDSLNSECSGLVEIEQKLNS